MRKFRNQQIVIRVPNRSLWSRPPSDDPGASSKRISSSVSALPSKCSAAASSRGNFTTGGIRPAASGRRNNRSVRCSDWPSVKSIANRLYSCSGSCRSSPRKSNSRSIVILKKHLMRFYATPIATLGTPTRTLGPRSEIRPYRFLGVSSVPPDCEVKFSLSPCDSRHCPCTRRRNSNAPVSLGIGLLRCRCRAAYTQVDHNEMRIIRGKISARRSTGIFTVKDTGSISDKRSEKGRTQRACLGYFLHRDLAALVHFRFTTQVALALRGANKIPRSAIQIHLSQHYSNQQGSGRDFSPVL
jgi:hypothetical protein